MNRRRKVLVAIAMVALVAVGGFFAWFYLSAPPERIVFGRVEIGMQKAEVERLIPNFPTGNAEMAIGSLTWEGIVDGQVRRVRCDLRDGDPDSEPLLRNAQFGRNKWQTHEVEPGLYVGNDESGRTREMYWEWSSGVAGVVYDEHGQVVEKSFGSRARPPWWWIASEWWSRLTSRKGVPAPAMAPFAAPAPGDAP